MYGFIVPLVVAVLIGIIPILGLLQPLMYLFMIGAGIVGLINIF